jgi:CBS domain-containing protein
MKVREIMTTNAKVCTPTDSLAQAATVMWEADCGIVPVVTDGGRVVGLITDRDICMAANFKNRNLANIAVEDVISSSVFSCSPDDDVRVALKTMEANKVRRLPVIAVDGILEGLLSMNDVVVKAEETKEKKLPEISFRDVVNTYKSIGEHRRPVQQAKAAAAPGV